jgi:hypothetical protein
MSRLIFAIALAAVLAMYFTHLETSENRDARDRGQVAERIQESQSYDGPFVTITGKVVGAAAVFGRGGYWIQAANGTRTLIVSATGVPPLNSVVTVSGTVHQAVVLNNEHLNLVVQSN